LLFVIMVFVALVVGLLRPSLWALTLIPAVCVVVGVVAELSNPSTDQPELSFVLGVAAGLAALITGLAGYGIVALVDRRRSRP
jgi:hypothetical protein